MWWRTAKQDQNGHNIATVVAILPYTGLYKQFFDCVLKLTAVNTRRGYVEMADSRADAARRRDQGVV